MKALRPAILVAGLIIGAQMNAQDDPNFRPNFSSEFCKKHKSNQLDRKKLDEVVGTPSTVSGLALYKQVAMKQPAGANIVYSPLSAHLLLGMLTAGASKDTLKELLTLLHISPKYQTDFAPSFGSLVALLTCPGEYSTQEFSIANGIFRQKGKPLQKPFLKTMKDHFDTSPQDVDYKDASGAAKTINSWVSDKTAGKITDLINEQAITPEMKMVLVNAVYFKDGWANVFELKDTKPKDFFKIDGSKVKTPMMFRRGQMNEYSYSDLGDLQAVGLNTSSREADLIILLPSKKDGIHALEKKLDSTLVAKIFKSLDGRRVNLTLPKFKIESDIPLTDQLKALGVKKMFQAGEADFSPMDGGADHLFVSSVLQKAVIEVHEKGIEAAAATTAMMEAGGMPPKPTTPVDFTADHPFMYLLRHRESQTILFMGRVMQP